MTQERYKKIKHLLDRRQPDLTVIMEYVHNPHNFSAILRSCDAVGVFTAHTIAPEGEMPTYTSTARGSEKWVNLHLHSDIKVALQHLKEKGFRILAAHLSENSLDYRQLDYTLPTAILLGSEYRGVSETALTFADQEIVVPMVGMVQSLNVSVAAAVILFEVQRQRSLAGMYDEVRLDPQSYQNRLFELYSPKAAAFYQERGLAYPLLNEEGQIVE